MIPEARIPWRQPPALLLALALLPIPALCEGSGAFGMDSAKLSTLLAGNDPSPILALPDSALDDQGSFGPAAYCYLATRLEAMGDGKGPRAAEADSEARKLYRRAYESSSGLLRREAGAALLGSLRKAGLWRELADFSAVLERDLGPSWTIDSAKLAATSALGLYADTATIAEAAYPEAASESADELDYYSALAALRSPRGGGTARAWRAPFKRLILERPYSEWSSQAFSLIEREPRLAAAFSEAELHAAAMRDAVLRKEYGVALKEARLAQAAIFAPSASKALVSDAGKAYLYSGSSKEAEPLFAALGNAAARPRSETEERKAVAWAALYYRARFARAQGRWNAASSLFAQAAAGAAADEDADSCLWYAVDSQYRGAREGDRGTTAASPDEASRAALLGALAAASASWRDPDKFSDLVGGLLEEALRAKDYRLVEAMDERLAGRLDAETAARVAYVAARLFELGLEPADSQAGPGSGVQDRGPAAAVRFAAVADTEGAPIYYRALASWRAGIEPILVPPAEASPTTPPAAEPVGELESYLAGMADFGLPDRAFGEARSRASLLGEVPLRRLALRFASLGRTDLSIRLALGIRPGAGGSARADWELLYPRPYLDLIRSSCSRSGLEESLGLALVRSESVFNAGAKSWVGASGLTQLMPATAASQAKSMGIGSYDLKDPKDNLDIGLGHFASLLRLTGGKAMRAMMAYNAGWGKYRSATAAGEGLPDDLLAETVTIPETRLYCRKILEAAAIYGALYYGRGAGETVGGLVEGIGRPAGKAP